MPFYFHAVRAVQPVELLAQRIVWCGLLIAAVIACAQRTRDLIATMRTPGLLMMFAATAALLSLNWLVYIYGIQSGQTVQTSLGYFVNPLVSVALGVAFLGERMRAGQAVALALATTGVAIPILIGGNVPWIACILAVSFGLYGLLRKTAPVDALVGLAIETFILMPVALTLLGIAQDQGTLTFAKHGATTAALVIASGIVTAVPLLCFGQAARLLPLSMLGFIQYLAPTLQFLTAVLVFGEVVSPVMWVSFGLIWLALAVYTAESLIAASRKAEPLPVAPLD